MARTSRRRRKSSDANLGALFIIALAFLIPTVVSLIKSPLSFVAAVALLSVAIWYGHVMAFRQAEARRRWHDIQHVRSLPGVAFEHHVAELYEKLGYRSRVTRGSGDQGADVIAEDGHERLAIQCKQWTETVGNDAVQEAIAGKAFYSCDRAIVVCTTSFTLAAMALAERAKVTLLNGEAYAGLMARVHPRTLETRTIHGVRVPSGKILAYEVVMIVAAFALILAHISTYSRPQAPISAGTTSQESASPVASQGSGALTSATQLDLSLPITILHTSQALPQMNIGYPAYVHVRVPTQWAHALSAYGVDGVVLVAPTGWTGEGSMGADGSARATLHSLAGSPSAGWLTYTRIPVCYGCALSESARYFSWVRETWSSLSNSTSVPIPPARPILQEVPLTHSTLAYLAPGTADGLEVNGVAYSVVDQRNAGLQLCRFNCALFADEELALPGSQHSLASAILNAFIANNIPRP